MDCSPSGSSVHRILQARILEWVALPSSRGSSQPGIQPRSPACRQILYQLSLQGSPLCPLSSVQFSRPVVSDSFDPVDCSTPGLPVHHQLPEFTQTHVHRVGDAIQSSHPLSSPSPPSFNLSQFRVFSNESVLHIR